ncbi:MAG: HNH endonuclease [Bacteroidales bacterium]|nr:HNH endonuclease [Bacteroidales bacterium]
MRPVAKLQPGDVVVYSDSNGETIHHIIESTYDPHRKAKEPLMANIGTYCSFCEERLPLSEMEIEHTIAISNGGSSNEWDNFLLSCKICNTVKSNKSIPEGIHWPHKNNTFLSFVYDETGRVKVNTNIPALSQQKAWNLLRLVQLDRYPNTQNKPTQCDNRWKRRFEIWNIATDRKDEYLKGRCTVNAILDLAKECGHWSIWYSVFEGVNEIRQRLLSDFEGTCTSCFDPQKQYAPSERNPNQSDPI